jgi:hypothetical protein
MPIVNLIVLKKFNDPKDEQNYELGKVYKKKLATNFFKIFYYSSTTIFGFLTLSKLEYFPVTLGGNGALKNMFLSGYPDSFFHYKPDYFDIYYMTGLGFCLTDLIWLLFIYELQTDFKMMLLHHICTISLITFSYLTNYSNIGCIILFLHDVGDIFVYLARIIINIEVKSFFKIGSGILLVIVFIYTRIYVLGEIFYTIWNHLIWEWEAVEHCLVTFLFFLYIMHINWVYLIFRKIYSAMFENKIEDTSHVKKVSKSN